MGNLSDEVQRMLLRAIQSRSYRPKGADADKDADVRIIAATNEDLAKAVAERRFRQDLYFRLREFTITVPPLRKNREDILPLAGFFKELADRELGKHAIFMSSGIKEKPELMAEIKLLAVLSLDGYMLEDSDNGPDYPAMLRNEIKELKSQATFQLDEQSSLTLLTEWRKAAGSLNVHFLNVTFTF